MALVAGRVPQPASEISFLEVCQAMRTILHLGGSGKGAQTKKRELLKKLMSLCQRKELFAMMRLLIPEYDRERNTYGMKEKVIAEMYIEALALADRDYHAAGQRYRRNTTLVDSPSITDVNDWLDTISKATSKGAGAKSAKDRRLAVFKQITARMNNCEMHYWFVKIILKDLKLGCGANTVLNVYHQDATAYYDSCTDLRKVLEHLLNQSYRIPSGESIKLMTPFRPMLAMRCTEQDLQKSMRNDGGVVIENKLDGERLLIHKKGKDVHMFSRKCTDYTKTYKDLAPHVVEACGEGTECILDGEIMTWDPVLKTYGEFGTLKTVAKGEVEDDPRWLCITIFDIVWLHGESLLGQEWKVRRRHLESLLKSCPLQGTTATPRVELAKVKTASTLGEVKAHMTKACFEGPIKYEGIMIKQVASQYVVNERKDKWIKLKPDMLDHFGDDLDLIILGGYFGRGHAHRENRGGQVAEFLLGVAVPGSPEKPHKYHSFCKAGTGMTLDEMKSMMEQMKWREWEDEDPPPHIMMSQWKKMKPDDKPHVWCKPEDSVILQVHGYEITSSDTMSAGMTVRFPRIARWRQDKEWWEGDKFESLKIGLLYKDRVDKRGANDLVFLESRAKKKQKTNKVAAKQKSGVIQGMAPINRADVSVTGDCFKGLQFEVMVKPDHKEKAALETLIVANGGEAIGTSTKSHQYTVALDRTWSKVKNVIEKCGGERNVYSPKWVHACIEAGKLVDPTPAHVVHQSDKLREQFSAYYDAHGDHFTEPATAESVGVLLAKMGGRPWAGDGGDLSRAWKEMRSQVGGEQGEGLGQSHVLFLNVVAHVVDGGGRHSEVPMLQSALFLHGAHVVPSAKAAELTHVVVAGKGAADLESIGGRRSGVSVVTKEWVRASIREGVLFPEGEFEVV